MKIPIIVDGMLDPFSAAINPDTLSLFPALRNEVKDQGLALFVSSDFSMGFHLRVSIEPQHAEQAIFVSPDVKARWFGDRESVDAR